MSNQVNLATRVDQAIADQLDALLPVLQRSAPYTRLSRSDAVRACLLLGLQTMQESEGLTTEFLRKPTPGPVDPGRSLSIQPPQIPAPDPAPGAAPLAPAPLPILAPVPVPEPAPKPGRGTFQQTVNAKHLQRTGHIREPGPNGCKVCDRDRNKKA